MRFFELNNNTAQLPQADPSNLEGLLAQTKDNPKAFSIAAQGIDALLNATNKMVSLIKASPLSSVTTPVNKILPTNPLESTFSEAADSIPTYQQRLKTIEENVKFLKTMTKANKKMFIKIDEEHDSFGWFSNENLPTPITSQILDAITRI